MNKELIVTIHHRIMGNLFKKEQRSISISDKAITLSEPQLGKWPNIWDKNDIVIKKDVLNLVHKVSFKSGKSPDAFLSTFTKKTYIRTMLLSTICFFIPSSILVSSSSITITGPIVGISIFIIVALETIAVGAMVYLPYKRLSSELKSHGYTIN